MYPNSGHVGKQIKSTNQRVVNYAYANRTLVRMCIGKTLIIYSHNIVIHLKKA